MKILALLLLLPTVAFGQQPIYSVDSGERLTRPGSVSIANFNGNKQRELRLQIWNRETDKDRLVFLDTQTYREVASYPITLRQPYEVMSSDIDGDGITETLIIPEIDHSRPLPGETCFVIVRRVGDGFLRTEFREFWGAWGHAGDVNGDGRDEIILFRLPRGYTNLGGTGPIEIQVLEWNGSDFDLVSSVSLPVMYLKTEVEDLDGDGRAEIIALKSGGNDQGVPHPRQLAIYTYTGDPQLTLLDEVTISTEYDDNMTLMWTEPVAENKQRIIVPIPEKWENHMERMRILYYEGYRFADNQLVQESEHLPFKWKYYSKAPLTLALQNQIVDLSGDGSKGYLQIEDRKHLKFIKQLPSVLPH